MYAITLSLIALIVCSYYDLKEAAVKRKTLYLFLGLAIILSLLINTPIYKYGLICILGALYIYQNITEQIIGNADVIILMILFLLNSFELIGLTIAITITLNIICYFLKILKTKEGATKIIPLILISYLIALLY